MSYQKDKARRKWISLIKDYKHIELMNLLWRLKVITQRDRMSFIEEKTHNALEQHERKKRKDNSYKEERPRWGKPTNIKPINNV